MGASFLLFVAPGAPAVVSAPTVWDSVDLLRRFKREAGLSDASEEDDDLDLYPILASAECEVIREIAARYPDALRSTQGPMQLTPSSDRKTFTFGTDGGGNPILPLGEVQISPRRTAFVGDQSYYWRSGLEFLDEGIQIRIPGNRTWTGELWGRWIPTPPGISASVQPVLQPAEARELIVIKAVESWAGEGNVRPDLVDRMQKKWGGPHNGYPPAKFATWMLTYRRRFRGGGALLDPAQWYLWSPDLASR